MAIKGPYKFRGLNIPQAYIRVEQVMGSYRQGFTALVNLYANKSIINPDNPTMNVLQSQPINFKIDSGDPFKEAYRLMKAMPEFADFVDD